MDMRIQFVLYLPRDEVSVPVVRHVCRDALQLLGVESPCIHDIEIAVTEACTNVLKHAAGTKDDYEVSVEVSEERCIIRVVDMGRGFDHESLATEAVAATAEGGRGIQLMRALVDELTFVSKPEAGTVVHLEKSLELCSDSVLEKLAALPAV